MSMLQSISAAWPARRSASTAEIEQEILDELEFHLEMRTTDNLQAGMSAAEARDRARDQFGDFSRIHQACRRALLGERIMWQRIHTAVTVVLLIIVGWIALRSYTEQQAASAALADVKRLVKQLEATRAQAKEAAGWQADRPTVVATSPENGATDVDPATAEIRITYNKTMADGSWSWVRAATEAFPESTGKIRYLEDGKTCVMPVKLEAGKKYVVWLNTSSYQNFKDTDGRPAEPYLLSFTTRE